jgi:hypothetical protein
MLSLAHTDGAYRRSNHLYYVYVVDQGGVELLNCELGFHLFLAA